MTNNLEIRVASLEAKAEFQLANALAIQTVLIAALDTVNRNQENKVHFVGVLRAAAEGSSDHAIAQAWSDQVISVSRRGMASLVGTEIAESAGLHGTTI